MSIEGQTKGHKTMKTKAEINLEKSIAYHAANPDRAGEPVATCSIFPKGLRVAPYDFDGMKGYCIVHADTGAVFKLYYTTEYEAINRIKNYYCKD